MDTQPLVSVIIPTYNAEKWIEKTIQSALAQTYPATEVIVVDDCSSDQTRKVLASFGDKIHVINNEINQGVSASRNIAIKASKGDYVALLDHDDLWDYQKIEKQMALFRENPKLGLVYSDATYQEIPTKKTWRSFEVDTPFRNHVFTQLLEHNFILCLTAVIPRAVLNQVGLFRPDFKCAEDYELFLRIAEQAPVDYIDEPLATYRVHDQNFTRNIDICHGERVETLKTYRKKPGVRGSIATAYVQWGREILRSEKSVFKGWSYILKGLLYGLLDPFGFLKNLFRSCAK